MFRSNTTMMRKARPLIAAARPASFESCRAFCAEKRAPACDKPTCRPRALAKKAAPRKVTQKGKGSFSGSNVVLSGFLMLPIIANAVLAAVIVAGVIQAQQPPSGSQVVEDPFDSVWETLNVKEVIQLYEHALTQGLTPSLELMTKAAVAYARTANCNKFFDRSNKKALRLMDSLTLQGYQPTDPAERIAWGRTYANAQRYNDATAVLQEPMRSNTTQEHMRHYYLCNIYTHTGNMAAVKCIVAKRKGQ
eukprot:9726-Heterococcus_DN1.PRE.3